MFSNEPANEQTPTTTNLDNNYNDNYNHQQDQYLTPRPEQPFLMTPQRLRTHHLDSHSFHTTPSHRTVGDEASISTLGSHNSIAQQPTQPAKLPYEDIIRNFVFKEYGNPDPDCLNIEVMGGDKNAYNQALDEMYKCQICQDLANRQGVHRAQAEDMKSKWNAAGEKLHEFYSGKGEETFHAMRKSIEEEKMAMEAQMSRLQAKHCQISAMLNKADNNWRMMMASGKKNAENVYNTSVYVNEAVVNGFKDPKTADFDML